jgi:hypothetical protein
MKRAELDALLKCRRERERRALASLARFAAARDLSLRAEMQAVDARNEQETMRRSRERQLYESLAGRRLSVGEMARINDQIATMSTTVEKLASRVTANEAETKRWDGLVETAPGAVRRRRHESLKWEALTLAVGATVARDTELRDVIELEEDSGTGSAMERK